MISAGATSQDDTSGSVTATFTVNNIAIKPETVTTSVNSSSQDDSNSNSRTSRNNENTNTVE